MTAKIVSETAFLHSLGVLQEIVVRMSSNCANCKTWCITLTAAILVVFAEKGGGERTWLLLIPIGLFMFLDCYYLTLERTFRKQYTEVVMKLARRSLTELDLEAAIPRTGDGKWARGFLSSAISPSILIFYGMLSLSIGFLSFL